MTATRSCCSLRTAITVVKTSFQLLTALCVERKAARGQAGQMRTSRAGRVLESAFGPSQYDQENCCREETGSQSIPARVSTLLAAELVLLFASLAKTPQQDCPDYIQKFYLYV
mmetsp:Transcript_82565/g.159516  ORF Transcript_82565/g.159516 Transcript_82565/m.159516 type:complete len:113 (+) Transcript_82565:444-782(+)